MSKRYPWSCLNPDFKYTPAAATDVGTRFRRILRAQERWRRRQEELPDNVTPLAQHSREMKRGK